MCNDRVQELEAGVANMKRQQDRLMKHVRVANEQKTKLEVLCSTFLSSLHHYSSFSYYIWFLFVKCAEELKLS